MSTMMMRPFAGRVMSCIQNPAKLAVGNLARERLQIAAQFLAESPQVGQEFLAVGLKLVANLLPLLRGRGVVQLNQQETLLMQVLVSGLIKTQNQGLYIVRHPSQITQQIAVSAILRHNCGRRRSSVRPQGARAD